jgi:Extensin-like protein C-terminus
MMRRLRCYLLGAIAVAALGLLAGCSGRYFFAEREPWRHDAEVECLNSGAVKEGPGKVRISPIEGPGICGADFPFKVSSLGDSAPLSYDDPRPPAAVPNASGQMPPRWPITQPPSSAAVTRDDLPLSDRPLSLDPSGGGQRTGTSPEPYDFRRPYGAAAPRRGAASAPASDPSSPYDFSPEPYDRRAVIGARPAPRPAPPAPPPPPPPGPVAVSPPATLACPLISALDQWIAEAVQPAALKWFGEPVVEIKQISAYSCRGMNGDPNATISEHAFGNALDIAAFTFADGRKLDVQHGWHGSPEEQAFLHDVQATACDQFTTVLAPGYNVYHYNHIHVDLMRRRNGRHACEPTPVRGDEVATRLGAHVAARQGDVTGSLSQHRGALPRGHASSYSERKSDRDPPDAVPGADGED